ncbi:MAG: amidohydrolase [Deltaproteobacteria bacterium]|nr:amidohydrolase [Deltaproteobacteria bacterium]
MRSPVTADLVLHGGYVLTLDPRRPQAEAVAIAGSTILAVGSEHELRPLLSSRTQRLSCIGRTVLPGFIDPHLHFLAWASRYSGADASAARSMPELQLALQQQLARTSADEWVRGYGYDEFFLAERRHPTKHDLDAVTEERPILLRHRTGHAAVLNSRALELAGLNRDASPPASGIVERDAHTGEPTGVLFELEPFLRTVVPPLSAPALANGVRHVSRELLRQGVTSFHDASAGNTLEDLALFRRFHIEQVLASRTTVMVGIDALSEVLEESLPPFSGDEWVRLGSIKIMVHESRGALSPSPEELAEMIERVHRHGFQVAIHAVEEGPVFIALDGIARAVQRWPRPDPRHRLEHCSMCPPPFLETLQKSGSLVVMQPGFLYFYGEKYAAEVAADVQAWLYRTKSFLEYGIRVAGSSDCPIAPLAPLRSIQAAVTRRARSGAVLNPDEALDLLPAVSLCTAAGAWVGFEETTKGRIAPGFVADLVVLDGDITKTLPEKIGELTVETTIIDGRIVWSAADK